MSGRSRSRHGRLRLVTGSPDRRSRPAPGLPYPGLAGCDPATYVLFGTARGGAAVGGAYPVTDERGRLRLLPGEDRLDTWSAVTALAVRRGPGHARAQHTRRWAGTAGPTVSLTDRRLVVHGPGDIAAHVSLERIRDARAVLGPVRGRVEIELLLHCSDTGTSARLTLLLVLRRRAAARLVQALASAQRERWGAYDLTIPVAAEIAARRVQRSPRELRHASVVHMPLGVDDAIRGPGASPRVPQRMRAPFAADAAQAACATSGSANAPASSS